LKPRQESERLDVMGSELTASTAPQTRSLTPFTRVLTWRRLVKTRNWTSVKWQAFPESTWLDGKSDKIAVTEVANSEVKRLTGYSGKTVANNEKKCEHIRVCLIGLTRRQDGHDR
jgi:hypothetical protein